VRGDISERGPRDASLGKDALGRVENLVACLERLLVGSSHQPPPEPPS
jgi:hypothetical protein